MYSVLINAYAIAPNWGSEQGMGWNWMIQIAQFCKVYVITEGEWRSEIEAALENLPQRDNIRMYYNPVSPKVREMCWNQGDWRFYYHYKKWQKKTAEIAESIIEKEGNIDILHQLNMIGFREPGYLWKVSQKKRVPFVWGPIGGLKQFPMTYARSGGWKMCMFLGLKNILNIIQINFSRRVVRALHQASLLIASIPDAQRSIKRWHRLDSIVIPETGCFTSAEEESGDNTSDRFHSFFLNVIWVGKFDFRKRLDIALESIAMTNNPNIRLKIFGTGSDLQVSFYKSMVENLGIQERVEFMGSCPKNDVMHVMKESDLFFFTSVNEDTSSVVMEAISNKLPILCFDTCGMSEVVDDMIGRKLKLSTPKQSIKEFSEWLLYFYKNRDELEQCSANCDKRRNDLSWENKAKMMVKLYEKICNTVNPCA